MSGDDSRVLPETRALDALIRRTVTEVLRATRAGPADAMLFLGNRHDAFPALLVQDPVLEPVDKIVWMVICQQGRATGTAFPRYEEIARRANIGSTSTIARAIAILRATRWLTLCVRVRDGSGRFRGSVYALHDEPLPLADTLHLDSDYMRFVEAARRHRHARVRKVAGGVLASLDDDIGKGCDPLAQEPPIERRLEATQSLGSARPRRYFSFSATVMARLANRPSTDAPTHQDQKSKADHLQNFDPQNSKAVRSSSHINNTTTTTANAREQNFAATDDALVYPPRLNDNQRALAARYLERVPAAQRQDVLDELEGRIRAEQRGAKPLYDELRYLDRLCSRVGHGGFQRNLGLKVQDQRAEQAKAAAQRRKQAQADAQRRQAERRRRPTGESPLAEARRILGLVPAKGAKTDKA